MTKQDKIEVGTGPHVYQAIAEVQGELAKTGIAKNRTNSQPGANYAFRGIDDVYAALSPLLAKHQLVVVPRVLRRECVERRSAKGNPLFNVTVHAEFDFISAIDGTIHTAATFGEAMDSGDKATNKAMSAAYKYAAFMTFAIPTEGDNDADGTTHEVAGTTHEVAATPQRPAMIADADRDLIQTLAPAAGKTVQGICEAYKIGALTALTDAQAKKLIERLQSEARGPAKETENA